MVDGSIELQAKCCYCECEDYCDALIKPDASDRIRLAARAVLGSADCRLPGFVTEENPNEWRRRRLFYSLTSCLPAMMFLSFLSRLARASLE